MLKIPANSINVEKFDMLHQILNLGIFNIKGVMLGGGSLQTLVNRNLSVNDFDLFFENYTASQICRNLLEEMGYKCVFKCKENRLFTYKRKGLPKIQIILRRVYTDPKDLIQSFDICACMWAFDGKYVYTTKKAIKDTKKQIVSINLVEYPLATLSRIGKYKHQKQFTVTPETYISFFKQIGVDISRYNTELYID